MNTLGSRFSQAARLLVLAAAAVPVLALSPAASAAIHPDGSARNVALRDSCGGANTNVNWSGDGVSTWGIVWDNSGCRSYQRLYLYYGNTQLDYSTWTSSGAAGGGSVGYNSGTLTFDGAVLYVAEQTCWPGGCSPIHNFT